jgi:hypothetical protein
MLNDEETTNRLKKILEGLKHEVSALAGHGTDKHILKEILRLDEEILHLEKQNRDKMDRILALLTHLPTGGTISILGDEKVPTNLSVVPGVASIFQFNPSPSGSSVPAADACTFAADDSAVVIAQVPGQPLQASVTFPATGDAATSFNLAAQLTGPDFPTPVNATPVNVTVVGSAPPPNLPTGGTITQLS